MKPVCSFGLCQFALSRVLDFCFLTNFCRVSLVWGFWTHKSPLKHGTKPALFEASAFGSKLSWARSQRIIIHNTGRRSLNSGFCVWMSVCVCGNLRQRCLCGWWCLFRVCVCGLFVCMCHVCAARLVCVCVCVRGTSVAAACSNLRSQLGALVIIQTLPLLQH